MTIFFDLDGTLYSYKTGHDIGLQSAFSYWSDLTGDDYETFISKYMESRKTVKRFLAGTVGSHSRALYFQGMVEKNFKTSLPYHIAELTQRYWDAFIEGIQPFDGVENVLSQLKETGHQLAIITNMSSEIQFRKLHRLNLDNYFEAVITSEEAGQEKPHPHVYLHAMDRMGTSPSDCIMIGDDYENDVEAPEFVGMKGILITIEQHTSRDDITTLSEFNDLIGMVSKVQEDPIEGVIKYKLDHRSAPMHITPQDLQDLIGLRDELWSMNLIGIYPSDHYLTPDVGFGNASKRYTGNNQFVISGSQTGEKRTTREDDYALVLDFDIDDNSLRSKGLIKPSSESLTHAAIYAVAPKVKFVIHAHHRLLWENYERLGMSTTPEDVPYGTPEMARAIQKVYHSQPQLSAPVCMLGHIEGLLTWGKTREEALQLYRDALQQLEAIITPAE